MAHHIVDCNHFDDYLKRIERVNLHPELTSTFLLFSNTLNKTNNIIFYGPSGVGKYSQALLFLSKYSPSKLTYEKKISFVIDKKTYSLKLSDIHYEIDMEIMGCNSKLIWHETYDKIIDIISANKQTNYTGVILCKNFHLVSNELLECFYSYMQQNIAINVKLYFMFITEDISFIPSNIIQSCAVIHVSKPSKKLYTQCSQHPSHKLTVSTQYVGNMKMLYSENDVISRQSTVNVCSKSCNVIIDILLSEKISLVDLRTAIYTLCVFNLNIHECIWYIVHELIQRGKITCETIHDILNELIIFFKYYNNNYRPIYHIEYILLRIRGTRPPVCPPPPAGSETKCGNKNGECGGDGK